MMFKLKCKSDGWKMLESAITQLGASEYTLKITPTGIIIKCISEDHTSMIDFVWDKTNFIEYTCDTDFLIGINAEEFSKIIKRMENNEVKISQTQKNNLNISIGGKKTYDIRSWVVDTLSPSPNVQYKTVIDLDSEELQSALEDVTVISDDVSINVKNDKLELTGNGDAGDVKSQCSAIIKSDTKPSTKYSSEILLSIVSVVAKYANRMKINMGKEKPIMIEFVEPSIGNIKYHLAPISRQ